MPSCDNSEGGKLSPTQPTLEYDIADPANFSAGIPHHLFAPIRATEGLVWNHDGPFGRGFWSVTRHADLIAVSRDPKNVLLRSRSHSDLRHRCRRQGCASFDD